MVAAVAEATASELRVVKVIDRNGVGSRENVRVSVDNAGSDCMDAYIV